MKQEIKMMKQKRTYKVCYYEIKKHRSMRHLKAKYTESFFTHISTDLFFCCIFNHFLKRILNRVK